MAAAFITDIVQIWNPSGKAMPETDISQLKQAVESQHGGTAAPTASVPIKEIFEGKTVWGGVVHVFDLEGNSQATRAYAWSSPIQGGNRRRFFAVLHLGGIRSPQDAVRAAIVSEHQSGYGGPK